MPIGRRITAFTAIAALVGALACSADSSMSSGQTVSDSEIDQSVASDVGESFAGQVDQYQQGESFQANMSSGSSTFAAGQRSAGLSTDSRSGAGFSTDSRTVTCGGPDSDGWYSCIAYTDLGLTISRQVRFWSGGSFALGWSPTLTDSVNHRWTRTGSFNSVAKPGKVFTLNDADTASMVVQHGSPVTHVWTGVGVRIDSSTYTVRNVTRLAAYTAHDTATALTFTMPRADNPYPTSGSIARSLELHFTAGGFSKTVTRTATVTFNGSSIAQLQVGALTCSLDLVTRVVSGCH
jgi:hypothetical protein